jgi:hypothetical protein
MIYLKRFNENKHQGELVHPKIVYHKSNPIFRDKISEEGLKPMKGDSYSLHSPEESAIPAIFGYIGDIDYYDSTYDDDIWEIKSADDITWYIDNEVGGNIKSAVMTYDSISKDKIRLLYKGTGKSY